MKSFDDYMIGDISLDGFQPVKAHYFSRLIEPAMTLRETSVSFNVSAYTALNCVAAVQLLLNESQRKILIRPINSSEPYAFNWIKDPQHPTSKPIECSAFTRPIFGIWKWEKKIRYRSTGQLVQVDKKLMLLFDFSSPEMIPVGEAMNHYGK